jgi:uncharacterized protein (DUF885 family)
MPALGSGTNAQPFATVKDYDNWLGRLDGFIVWMDQAIVNMREGMAKGVVQPRPVMEKVLPQLDAMIVEDPTKSDYYAPIRNLPASFTAADRERLTAAYTSMIRTGSCPRTVGCARSCRTSICRARARASRGRRCRTARPGTNSSWLSTRRRR